MRVIALSKYLNKLTYNSTVRLALIEKLALENTYMCPGVIGGRLFIELNNLINFDSSRVLAAFFVLRLLSGKKPYFLRFRLFQTFHTKDYDALAVVDFGVESAHELIELVSIQVLPFLSKADLSSYALKGKKGVVVNLTISDLSFIRVVETHSMFFK